MRYLVFGGAGYIGQNLCRQILKNGDQVLCFDNFSTGNKHALLELVANDNFDYIIGDARSRDDCLKAVDNKINYMILLNGLVGFPACQKEPDLSYANNVLAIRNAMEARNKINDKIPLFFSSTGSCFGKVDGVCTEDSPTNPQSLYGQHKLEAENILLRYDKVLIYRFATAFGLSPQYRASLLINDLTFQALKNKTITVFEADFIRTFIHNLDFCNSILFGLDNIYQANYKIYNCGDNNLNLSKRDLAEYLRSKTQCEVIYNDFSKDLDQRSYKCSFDRINEFGFQCRYNIEQGINELIKGYNLLI